MDACLECPLLLDGIPALSKEFCNIKKSINNNDNDQSTSAFIRSHLSSWLALTYKVNVAEYIRTDSVFVYDTADDMQLSVAVDSLCVHDEASGVSSVSLFVNDQVPGVPPCHVLDLAGRERRGAVGHGAERDEGVAAGRQPGQHGGTK